MSEDQKEYDVQQEVTEAMEMLGKGYDDEQPSVIVEPPRKRTERRGRRMVEVEEPAFVKFSTEFKKELADLDVYALKVFIYIGLSINFQTETAFPGIRKIAKETSMDKDTVGKAIDELESKGFMKVWRRDGISNTYKPTSYFAIGETVPRGRTPAAEPSGFSAELSDENAELSDARRVNRAQLDKQELTRERESLALDFKNMTVGEARRLKTIKLYTDATDFFPGSVLWETVHNTITENNLTFEQLHAAAVAWAGKGFKSSNVAGVLEWAVKGVPGAASKAAAAPVEHDPYASLKEMLARQESNHE